MQEPITKLEHDKQPFVLFEIARTTYAVRSHQVKQIQMVERLTPLPNAIKAVEGVVYSSGHVIPAVNLRVRFGFEKVPFDLRSRLVVVTVDTRSIGLLVDTAREFMRIAESSIAPTPEGITGLSAHYLEGIATVNGRLIFVLNLPAVIDIDDTGGLPADNSEGSEG